MFKNRFLLGLMVTTFSLSVLATPAKTIKCPSVESIQHLPWSKIYQYEPFWMLEKAKNFYDTEDEWLLMMMYILAKDEKEAILKADEAQKSLKLQGLQQHEEHWHCVYNINGPTPMATAVSPPKWD